MAESCAPPAAPARPGVLGTPTRPGPSDSARRPHARRPGLAQGWHRELCPSSRDGGSGPWPPGGPSQDPPVTWGRWAPLGRPSHPPPAATPSDGRGGGSSCPWPPPAAPGSGHRAHARLSPEVRGRASPALRVGPGPVGRLLSGLDLGPGPARRSEDGGTARPARLRVHASGLKSLPEGPGSDETPFPDGAHRDLYMTCNFSNSFLFLFYFFLNSIFGIRHSYCGEIMLI